MADRPSRQTPSPESEEVDSIHSTLIAITSAIENYCQDDNVRDVQALLPSLNPYFRTLESIIYINNDRESHSPQRLGITEVKDILDLFRSLDKMYDLVQGVEYIGIQLQSRIADMVENANELDTSLLLEFIDYFATQAKIWTASKAEFWNARHYKYNRRSEKGIKRPSAVNKGYDAVIARLFWESDAAESDKGVIKIEESEEYGGAFLLEGLIDSAPLTEQTFDFCLRHLKTDNKTFIFKIVQKLLQNKYIMTAAQRISLFEKIKDWTRAMGEELMGKNLANEKDIRKKLIAAATPNEIRLALPEGLEQNGCVLTIGGIEFNPTKGNMSDADRLAIIMLLRDLPINEDDRARLLVHLLPQVTIKNGELWVMNYKFDLETGQFENIYADVSEALLVLYAILHSNISDGQKEGVEVNAFKCIDKGSWEIDSWGSTRPRGDTNMQTSIKDCVVQVDLSATGNQITIGCKKNYNSPKFSNDPSTLLLLEKLAEKFPEYDKIIKKLLMLLFNCHLDCDEVTFSPQRGCFCNTSSVFFDPASGCILNAYGEHKQVQGWWVLSSVYFSIRLASAIGANNIPKDYYDKFVQTISFSVQPIPPKES